MLNLKKLKELVHAPHHIKAVPSAKSLRESGDEIVAQRKIHSDGEVVVYQSGYVVYRSDKRVSVFHLHDCGDYEYAGLEGSHERIEEAYFNEQEWHLRVLLEGEDRLVSNQARREERNHVSYSAVAEDWAEMAETGAGILEKLVEGDTVHRLLHGLDELQKRIVHHHVFLGKSQREVAREFGLEQWKVNRAFHRAVKHMVSVHELEFGGAV